MAQLSWFMSRYYAAQVLIFLLSALILLFLSDMHHALSALLGGIAATIPSLIFAMKAFRYQKALDARRIMRNFYVGEGLKILTSALIFSLTFRNVRVEPLAFFGTYIAVMMSIWLTPFFDASSRIFKTR